MRKLNVTFCSYPDFSGNARALYLYMKKKYKDKMNYTWIFNDSSSFSKIDKSDVNAILIDTNEFKKYISKTDVFFTTHCNLAGDKVKKSLYIELWHGLSPKKVGYMMNNISSSDSEWYNFLSRNVDYFIVPSEFWALIFSARFNVSLNQCLPIGYPKLDIIKDKNAHSNLSKVLETDVSKYKKIIYYMPTFRKGCGRDGDSAFSDNYLNLKKYDENDLIDYLKKNNYLLCIKKHPSEEGAFLNKFVQSSVVKLITEERLVECGFDIYNILDASDVMITDYSSLGVEYLFLDKPVIYIGTDFAQYNDSRGICYKNFDFWSSNNSVSTINDLISAIDNCQFNNLFSTNKKLFFGDLEDGCCKKICSYFFNDDGTKKKNVKPFINANKKCEILDKKLCDVKNDLDYYKRLSNQKIDELNLIYNSRSWKILEKLRKILKRRRS